MLVSSNIINTLLAVVVSLICRTDAHGAPHHGQATIPSLPLAPGEVLHSVSDSDRSGMSESPPPGEGSNSSQSIPLSIREYWMRRANRGLSDLVSPCPFAAFASVIVNHTDTSSSPLGRLICVGVNSGFRQGNPILHGEIDAINRCSETLQRPPFDLTPAEALLAFRDLTLYTNGEPCSMCASAIRWAGFRECVYGTSIETLIRLGWTQIEVSSQEIFARSGLLQTTTTLIPSVLTAETDPFFSWQFNLHAPCPELCTRDTNGTCVPN